MDRAGGVTAESSAPQHDPRWDAARALVLRHGWNAVAYQVLNPGMRLWLADAEDAVVGYVTFDGVRIVAGAPICAESRLPAVVAAFEQHARAHGESVLYFGAGHRLGRMYADAPARRMIRIGALPVWDPRDWAAIVAGKPSLRAQLNRARNKGVTVTEWTAQRARESTALRRVLREWLDARGLPPLAFLVMPELLDTLQDRRVFVAERTGAVISFLVATPVPARDGWLVEQWPRATGAPNGTTHLMVDAAMQAFAAEGCGFVTLGLSPLAERAGEVAQGSPRWLRWLLRWIAAHGRRFYNFRGLEAFKAGMGAAHWEPIFLILPEGVATPRALRAVAGAFSRGSPERLLARALVVAAVHEARRLFRVR